MDASIASLLSIALGIGLAAAAGVVASASVVSTAETVGATGLSILAIALPILCLIVVLALLIWVVRSTRRLVLRLRADPQK